MIKYTKIISDGLECKIEIDGNNVSHKVGNVTNYNLPIGKTFFRTIENLVKIASKEGYGLVN